MTTILVALDASERAPHVLHEAMQLARERAAKLVLLRVIGLPGELPLEAYAMSPDDLIVMLRERGRAELAEFVASISDGILHETQVEIGNAWEVICEKGKQLGAAVIVMGSHGYEGLDKLLGTTAARVVNHADRSVFVVR